jgi:hypothetical protein
VSDDVKGGDRIKGGRRRGGKKVGHTKELMSIIPWETGLVQSMMSFKGRVFLFFWSKS